jgi:hypothetical protein
VPADANTMPSAHRQFGALIAFGETHHPLWEVDPPAFGLDPKREQAWWEKVKTARERMEQARAAQQAARAATVALDSAINDLRRDTAAITAQIRAFAGYGGQEGESPEAILARAGLNPFRKRGPKRRAA